MAVGMARRGEQQPVKVTLLHVIPTHAGPLGQVRADQVFREALEGTDYEHVERQIAAGSDITETILRFAKGPSLEEAYDLIVIGATNEPLFKNLLVGNLSQRVAKEAQVTVIVVKRRSSRLHSLLRQTVLEPGSDGEATG